MPDCWICGAQADSGEHRIKKTDLQRVVSGTVNQQSPIYHRANGIKKRPIGSLKAEALKFDKSICANCNGSLTQPYDYSWDVLADYLSKNKIEVGQKLDLSRVFSENIEGNILNVYLFFCKIFGCVVVDSSFDLDLSKLAESLTTKKVCPDLYIKIRRSNNGKSGSYCALSDLEVCTLKDRSVKYSHIFYTVGEYSVDVLYSQDITDLDLTDYFKPNSSISKLTVGKAEYIQEYKK